MTRCRRSFRSGFTSAGAACVSEVWMHRNAFILAVKINSERCSSFVSLSSVRQRMSFVLLSNCIVLHWEVFSTLCPPHLYQWGCESLFTMTGFWLFLLKIPVSPLFKIGSGCSAVCRASYFLKCEKHIDSVRERLQSPLPFPFLPFHWFLVCMQVLACLSVISAHSCYSSKKCTEVVSPYNNHLEIKQDQLVFITAVIQFFSIGLCSRSYFILIIFFQTVVFE